MTELEKLEQAVEDTRDDAWFFDECLDHLGYSKVEANRNAGLNRLPIPTFRLRDSQKSPRMVHLKDLAEHIDSQHAIALNDWRRMND